jgi:hypothetical protein
MESIVFRCLRSTAIAGVMYFSVGLLGLSPTQCLLAALIPLFLGCLDVMLSFSYILTGCIFVIAILFHVAIPIVKETKVFHDLTSEFQIPIQK